MENSKSIFYKGLNFSNIIILEMFSLNLLNLYTIHDIDPDNIKPWKKNINLITLYECLSGTNAYYSYISSSFSPMIPTGYFIDIFKLDKTKISLLYIHKWFQTEECCLAAVKRNGMELYYVREGLRTPEICMAAVKQDGYAISEVKNKTPDICLAAVKQTPCALQFMNEHEQTEEICLEAVSKRGGMLFYVRNQTLKIVEAALEENPNVYEVVRIKEKII